MTGWTRRCAKTGLQLIANAGDYGFHDAKTEYPALSAAFREQGQDPAGWGRYDIPGQTYYVASTRQCAYAEVLSQFRLTATGLAKHLGVPLAYRRS